MNKDSRQYYEYFDWEEASLGERVEGKVEILLKTFPTDVKEIIDIGCGDGSITNKLCDHFFLIGTDRSPNALKYVISKKFCSSADSVPVRDASFDLVFSSEMIEHLPDEVFKSTINEFKRITKKYIYLTFPNDENIEKNFVQCPSCKTTFNKVYHLRNLNKKVIQNLFPEYEIVSHSVHGKKIKQYHRLLAKIKHKLVSPNAWIPMRWTPEKKRTTMCPKCETKFEIPYRFSLLGFLLDGINTLISPRLPYQQFILLKKKNAS